MGIGGNREIEGAKAKSYSRRPTSIFAVASFAADAISQNLLVFCLVSRNGAADVVLPLIQPTLLGPGQMTVVLSHVALLPLLQIGLPVFQASGLPRGQGAVLYAISNTLLLAAFATVDLVHPWMPGINNAGAGAGVLLRSGGSHQDHSPNRKD